MSGDALQRLASTLRDEDTVISRSVRDPEGDAALGRFAAAGPRAAAAPSDYAFVVEAIREGYLLHYGSSRIVGGDDPKLRLLAGDYLYALGLDRLAAVGDLEAVAVLSDLISGCARLHAEHRGDDASELWLVAVAAVAGTGVDEARARIGDSLAAAPTQ